MTRIAVGGLHTECCSYSPLLQTQADFTRTEGGALVELIDFDFAGAGIDVTPLFIDRSVPGGPVAPATWHSQINAFHARLQAALPLDGVLLLMHGAMFVPAVTDPEGDFIAAIRHIVGPQTLIAASFDLHGQVTQAITDALDIFCAYRTAPHIDVAETHTRAARLLVKSLRGGSRPMVCWRPVRQLVPGEMSSTFCAPCDRLYAALAEFDRQPGICDSNLMIGYVWADSPRATAAAVVTATDRRAGEHVAESIAASYRAARDELAFDMPAAALYDALDSVQGVPAIVADSGDNPTAGGVGDRADVLAAVIDRGLANVTFAGIADPAAFEALTQGAQRIELGGSLGGGGPRVTLDIESCSRRGACAVVESQGVCVVVTAQRRPFHHLNDFAELGLQLKRIDMLVVKSGYLSPELRTLARRHIMALTDGAVCQNLANLENRHRPAGTWPFDRAD